MQLLELEAADCFQCSSSNDSRLSNAGVDAAAMNCGRHLEDQQLQTMIRAYRVSGGLVDSDDLVRLLRKRASQPISILARWIVDRSVVSFAWHSQRYLPLFQFRLADMSVRPPIGAMVRELADVFDDWELALWFAESNAWLEGASPVDVVDRDFAAALAAARADRFVALG